MAHRSFPDPIEAPGDAIADGVAAARRLAGPVGPPWRQRAAVLLAVAVVALVGWWLLRPAPPPVEAVIPVEGSAPITSTAGSGSGSAGPASDATSEAPGTSEVEELVVQVAGAVARPGVYRLVDGDRVDDLVRAAGGFSADADRARLNLAAPLGDGERVWVPARGETEVPEVVDPVGGSDGGGGSPETPSAEEPVDLNVADAAELEALPGIGPATSAAIIAHRDEHGPFGAVDELLDVRGIGEAKLEQLRPLVTV